MYILLSFWESLPYIKFQGTNICHSKYFNYWDTIEKFLISMYFLCCKKKCETWKPLFTKLLVHIKISLFFKGNKTYKPDFHFLGH